MARSASAERTGDSRREFRAPPRVISSPARVPLAERSLCSVMPWLRGRRDPCPPGWMFWLRRWANAVASALMRAIAPPSTRISGAAHLRRRRLEVVDDRLSHPAVDGVDEHRPRRRDRRNRYRARLCRRRISLFHHWLHIPCANLQASRLLVHGARAEAPISSSTPCRSETTPTLHHLAMIHAVDGDAFEHDGPARGSDAAEVAHVRPKQPPAQRLSFSSAVLDERLFVSCAGAGLRSCTSLIAMERIRRPASRCSCVVRSR